VQFKSRCADSAPPVGELTARRRSSTSRHVIAKMDDHESWMAFFTEPDASYARINAGSPKGYVPPQAWRGGSRLHKR